jgi:hypothetical protein
LFDIISKKYMAKGVDGQASIVLPANQASLIVVLPAGTLLRNDGAKIKAGDVVIAYK